MKLFLAIHPIDSAYPYPMFSAKRIPGYVHDARKPLR